MANNIVITPPGRFSVPNVKHLWEAREVLFRFGARDVTLRYRQTLLGVVWVILQPLLTALVFTLVLGRVAKLPSDGKPYLLLVFSGLIAYNMFSDTITRASSRMSNAPYMFQQGTLDFGIENQSTLTGYAVVS